MKTQTNMPTGNGNKQAELVMQTGLQLLPLIMNNIPQAVFWKDRELVYLGCNKAFAEDAGFSSPEEIVGKTDFDMPWKNQAELYRADDRQTIEIGEPKLNYEEPHTAPDGSMTWVRTSRIPVRENGRVVAVLGMYEDITTRKQAEKALKESEEKFRAIADNTAIGLFIHQAGIMRYLGREAGRLLGYEVEDVIGHSIMDFIHPDERQRIAEMARRRTAGENVPDHYETRLLRKDGSALDVVLYSTLVNYEGKIATQGAFLDLTQRKQTEEALKAEQQRSLTILEAVTEAMIISRLSDSKVLYANQALAKIGNIDLEKLVGSRTVDYFVDSNDRDKVVEILQQYGQVSDFETQLRRGDGSLYWVLLSSRIINYQNETCVLSSYTDITARKQMEQQIQTAFERRGRHVQLSTQVSQAIAAATSMENLYQSVVTQVKEQFDYYHTQILRYDAAQNAVVLVTGYGEIGAKMLVAGHRLRMGEGLIGTAAAFGETVLRPALENDTTWQPNPLLPDTKGEIAIPIKLGEQVLGVLDVQSNQAGALTEDDRLLLEGLCGQIAVAIEQTRLRQEMAEHLEEVNRLYRTMSHEGWQTYRETADLPAGFMFDQAGIRPVDEVVLADELFTNIPMRVLGGEVVGTLTVANDPQHPTSPDDYAFLQQVSDQIALALESARLFGQTQSALAQTEKLSAASLRFAQSANLQELLAVAIETLNIPVVNRTLLGVFNYSSANELASMDIVANWWNGSGQAPSEIGRHYSIEALNVLPLFMSATPVFSNDTFHDERVHGAALELVTRQNIRSMAVLPLYLGSRQVGVLFLESEETHNFTQDETRLFTAMAPQIATVLENRQQFERAQQQAKRESTLNLISQKIQSATTVDAVLQIAARELGRALGAPMTIAQLGLAPRDDDGKGRK